MTSPDQLGAIAERLFVAERTKTPIEPVRDEIGDLGAAYQVQDLVRERWLADGRRMVGYKIGATSRAVREQFGLTEPDTGVLWADTVHGDGAEVSVTRLLMPRIETEVAFVLDQDLSIQPATVIDVMRATAFLLPAMELADCRIRDWDTSAIDSVCDNGSGGGAVLGCRPVRPADVDLRSATAVMEIDGHVAAGGRGQACMGNPWLAMVWLADFLSNRETPLQAGDIVLTGALLAPQPLRAGTTVRSTIDALGTVEIDAVR